MSTLVKAQEANDQGGRAVKLCRSKQDCQKLKDEFVVHRRIWSNRLCFPQSLSIPEPIRYHEFPSSSAPSSCRLSIKLPDEIRQTNLYAGIEMSLVPDMSEYWKSRIRKRDDQKVERFTPKITLGIRDDGPRQSRDQNLVNCAGQKGRCSEYRTT